jgi:hypothetical protein
MLVGKVGSLPTAKLLRVLHLGRFLEYLRRLDWCGNIFPASNTLAYFQNFPKKVL